MDDSTLPIPIETLKAMMEEEEAGEKAEEEITIEVNEVSEGTKEKEQDEIFEMPEEEETPKKKGKRQLSEKQLNALAKAREAGLKKRQAKAAAKKKEQELYKLEKTKHIRARKKKQLDDEALIMAHAETEYEQKEKAAWDEDRLVSLMNRTMDTYFEKRKKEKTHRTTVPMDPAQGGYYVPAQPPPPQRYAAPVQQVTQPPPPPIDRLNPNHPQHNPYLSLFNLK
tara:strand:+ start:1179 stop:1853 length:675 start_codon:yes stop_codon:yes gene_type:complete